MDSNHKIQPDQTSESPSVPLPVRQLLADLLKTSVVNGDAVQLSHDGGSAIELARLLAEDGSGVYINHVKGGWVVGETTRSREHDDGSIELAFAPSIEAALEAALARVRAQAA